MDARRAGRRVTIGAALLVAMALLAAILTVAWLNASLDRVAVDGLADQASRSDEPSPGDAASPAGDAGEDDGDDRTPEGADDPEAEALTVLLLGSDTRDNLSAEERRTLGTGDAMGDRTESIALVRLDPAADTIRVVNVPRDTLLTRCDGSRGRVNAAYGIGERDGTGGLSCVVQTLAAWSDIAIDHVVKVDFRGFVDIVDTLGGVAIDLDEPLVDEHAHLDLPAGCTRLDGAQALAFVRARGLDDDFGRQARQRRFLEELRREIADVGLLDEPIRFVRTAQSVASNLEVDDTLSLRRIERLARQHRITLRAPLEGRSIPGTIVVSDGIAFVEVDPADADESFRWLVHGQSDRDVRHDGSADGDPATGGPSGSDDTTDDAPVGSQPSDSEGACE